jgi:hypothetical protein
MGRVVDKLRPPVDLDAEAALGAALAAIKER